MLTLDATPRDWQEVENDLAGYRPRCKYKGRGDKRYAVLDTIVAFDTETTSITGCRGTKSKKIVGAALLNPAGGLMLAKSKPNQVKIKRETHRADVPDNYAAGGLMYAWAVAIQGKCYIGRTWAEFVQFKEIVTRMLDVSMDRRLYVWVHNLAFDFQFLRRHIKVQQMFATGDREAVTVTCMDGWVFRCTYKLTIASLAWVAENMLQKHNIRKLKGDLDYNLARGPWTPLTAEELGYICNDVLIVSALIDEKRETDGGITKIPLTSTSYVRQDLRDACFNVPGYRQWISSFWLTKTQYKQLSLCKGGGFVHSNMWHTGKILHDIVCYDIASSYPTVMICEKYPMSNWDYDPGVVSESDLAAYGIYCWYARVTLTKVQHTEDSDVVLSRSKCYDYDLPVREANGRILSADKITTWITNVDYDIIKDFYKWENMEIDSFHWAVAGYLPKVIVRKVLDYYYGKTALKHKDPVQYARSKAMLNSIFGCMLTDPIRDVIDYKNGDDDNAIWTGWTKGPPEIDEQLEKYNTGRNRWNWFCWGVWVTAHARRNITRAIKAFGMDYIYSDTDSCFVANADKHQAWFDAYNAEVDAKVRVALEYHEIDPEEAAPRDLEKDTSGNWVAGERHPIGRFEVDKVCDTFKTLGAKRYMYETGGKIKTTVAGCGKHGMPKYLGTFDSPFEAFEDTLIVPAEYTEKLTHTYGDNRIEGDLTDYLGNTGHYVELSWVHLGPCEYRLGMSDEFLWWINQYGQVATEVKGV